MLDSILGLPTSWSRQHGQRLGRNSSAYTLIVQNSRRSYQSCKTDERNLHGSV